MHKQRNIPCTDPHHSRFCCGVNKDCPLLYDLSDVNASVASGVGVSAAAMAAQNEKLSAACESQLIRSAGGGAPPPLANGGWCLSTSTTFRGNANKKVRLKHGQSYQLPLHHKEPDGLIVATLIAVLTRRFEMSTYPGFLPPFSLIDFGAGVGQFGHTLLSERPELRHRYRGYDGAGGIETYTKGFLKYVDLTQELALPRADWVLSLEVGEHITARKEKAFVHNLHAHNCKGVLLSWAKIGTFGHGHVNLHSPAYVRRLFEGLGYRSSSRISMVMRKGVNLRDALPDTNLSVLPFSTRMFWFRRDSVQAFERIVPLQGAGCT